MLRLTYHSLETPEFELFGFHWFPQDFLLRRLPLQPGLDFRPGVESLAWNTAGGRLRFRTDSRRIVLRGVRYGQGVMDHMSATGSHGFDLYFGAAGHERFVNACSCAQGDDNAFKITILDTKDYDFRDITIFFQTYEGIKRLEVGLETGAILKRSRAFAEDARPIVVYGTSITQGGCASRPGLIWTNQLSLKPRRDIYNFGFSGNGMGEPEVAQALAQIPDPALFILDYEANICGKLPETLPAFLDILREKHPDTPILMLSSYHFTPVHAQAHLQPNRQFVLAEIARRQKAGDTRISFLDGEKTMAPEGADGTVDGVHATDLGFYRIAQALAPHVEKLLSIKE